MPESVAAVVTDNECIRWMVEVVDALSGELILMLLLCKLNELSAISKQLMGMVGQLLK